MRLLLLIAAILCCLSPWQPQGAAAAPAFAVVDAAEGGCPLQPRGSDEWGAPASSKARTLGGAIAKQALPTWRGASRTPAHENRLSPVNRPGRAQLSIWRI